MESRELFEIVGVFVFSFIFFDLHAEIGTISSYVNVQTMRVRIDILRILSVVDKMK